ncbi:MAG: hypothetical protein ACI4O7_09305, partial [Aristaeellaceae bacterium]
YYDYSKSFSEQVDDWLNGQFPQRDTLLLGRTPNILRKIGFSDLPMTMDQKHMRMMLGRPKNVDHDLGVAIVKKLPELIADPVAVIADPRSGQNGRKQTAIVIFAQKNPKVPDRPVIGVVNVLENGKINGISIDSTFVETVHSRGDLTSRITEAVERENAGEVGVFYIKKEATSLLEPSQSQVLGTLVRDGFIHSISETPGFVNMKKMGQTDTVQFKRWFGDSQVVNEDGSPKVVYHATDEDFSVFDRGRLGSNTKGNTFEEATIRTAQVGFWFSDRDVSGDGSGRTRAMANEARESDAGTAETGGDTRLSLKEAEPDYANLPDSAFYEDGKIYDYDFLTAQKDAKVVTVPSLDELMQNGRINRADVVEAGKRNAGGAKTANGYAQVTNTYTGRTLNVSNESIKHGMHGQKKRLLTNAQLGKIVGDIVKEGIPINGLKTADRNALGTYAMVTMCETSDGKPIMAVTHVDMQRGEVQDISFVDMVHSVNGRLYKKSEPGSSPINASAGKPSHPSRFTISISDLLLEVNSSFQSILSEDVLNRLNETRSPEGAYTDKVKFSVRDDAGRDSEGRELSEQQQKYFAGSKVRDSSGQLMVMYHGTTAYGEITKFRKGKKGWLGPGICLTNRKSGAGTAETGGDAKFSIKEMEDGTKYVEVDTDQDIFEQAEPSEYKKIAEKYLVDHFRGKVIGNVNRAYVDRRATREYAHPARKNVEMNAYQGKLKSATELDNLLDAGTFIEHLDDDGRHEDAVGGWDKYRIIYHVDGRYFEAEASIMIVEKGKRFHDITKIRDITTALQGRNAPRRGNASDNSISDSAEKTTLPGRNYPSGIRPGRKRSGGGSETARW